MTEENVFKAPLLVSRNVETEQNRDESQSKTISLPQPLTQLTPPNDTYHLETLKNGSIINRLNVVKSRILFGRATDCDVILEHPSVSRYHAALLWSPSDATECGTARAEFWYLFDCDSTHGTFCNKTQIEGRKYVKLEPNNNTFKFGASTRIFALTSKDNFQHHLYHNEIPETNVSVKVKSVESGCTWGMNEEDDEEKNNDDSDDGGDDVTPLNAFMTAMKSNNGPTDNEHVYQTNPLKTMQQWFEREGYSFEFKIHEIHHKFKCTIELPIDGQWIPIEGTPLTKKKESLSSACLKACQILDTTHMLFPWQQSHDHIRKRDHESDSDPEDLIDETGHNEKKKARKEAKEKRISVTENIETLSVKCDNIAIELDELRQKLKNLSQFKSNASELSNDKDDSLDSFMETIKAERRFGLSLSDKIEMSKLKRLILEKENEHQKLKKLIKIAEPAYQTQSLSCDVHSQSDTSHTLKIVTGKTKDDSSLNESHDTIPEKSVFKNDTPIEILKCETIEKSDTKEETKCSVSNKKIRNDTKSLTESHPQSLSAIIRKEQQNEKKPLKYDDDYIDWIPPFDQSGDGKTHLNTKFGY